MSSSDTHVVTGAFGFSGKYIAKHLLNKGLKVHTLTDSPDRINPFNGRIKAHPFNFNNINELTNSLSGVEVLYNNYWVRFNHADFSYSKAVENSIILFEAAQRAGVRRIVHISITNPSEDSPFGYFKGKAKIEQTLIASGVSYVILRPAVLFGREDILINNIAWFLRNFPFFGVFGDGNYRLQPIYVDDLAKIAVDYGQKSENCIIDAIGPETFTYRELVEEIGKKIGKCRPVISIHPKIGYLAGLIAGKIMGDVTITSDEIKGLMADLLFTNSPPSGETRLTDWLKDNSSTLGMKYSNELFRRKNRNMPYEKL